jgi:hypothetical protein
MQTKVPVRTDLRTGPPRHGKDPYPVLLLTRAATATANMAEIGAISAPRPNYFRAPPRYQTSLWQGGLQACRGWAWPWPPPFSGVSGSLRGNKYYTLHPPLALPSVLCVAARCGAVAARRVACEFPGRGVS